MKTTVLFAMFLLYLLHLPAQELPAVASGQIIRITNLESGYVDARNIDIWLPESYTEQKKYSVVYMHDGQMLFDSTKTWNHQEWMADEHFSGLLRDSKIADCIVVGIWNNGNQRIAEYFPSKIYKQLDRTAQKEISAKYFEKGGAKGDLYLKFIVNELKPIIDSKYSTYSDASHTFMMGSSMGGLISIYALCEYPTIFGGIASLSTAWLTQIEPRFEFNSNTIKYIKRKLPSSNHHRIYMDYGTGESDSDYELMQSTINFIIRSKSYNELNYQTGVIPGAQHNERAWNSRLEVPILFLLGK